MRCLISQFTIFFMLLNVASASSGSDLRAAYEIYAYEKTVIWDQKDPEVLADIEGRFKEELIVLREAGKLNQEAVEDLFQSEASSGRVDPKLISKMTFKNGVLDPKALEDLKNQHSIQGAQWSPGAVLGLTLLGFFPAVILIAVLTSVESKQLCTLPSNGAKLGEYYQCNPAP